MAKQVIHLEIKNKGHFYYGSIRAMMDDPDHRIDLSYSWIQKQLKTNKVLETGDLIIRKGQFLTAADIRLREFPIM